jgi:HSP20 family protein
MDQLFGELAGGIGASGRGNVVPAAPVVLAPPVAWIPALDIFERDGQLVVQADLPGVAADNVTVEVEDGLLTVSGERREEREIDENGFRRMERRYGKFSRSIALPEGAKADDISATFRDGVLEITMPLAQPASNRRTIDIQTQNAPASEAGSTAAGKGAKAGANAGDANPQAATSGA